MKRFNGTFFFPAAVAAALLLVPVSYAQTASKETPSDQDGEGLRRAADLVNLLRGVFAPEPAPVLVSPVERAVSSRETSAPSGISARSGSAPRVVTTAPFVTMPNIEEPDEGNGTPDAIADSGAEKNDAAGSDATAKQPQKTVSADEDSDTNPPFYYVFFFGEYVPYYEGWYYYADRWFRGRRALRPLEPPGWIPPPPPPAFRPGTPDRPRPPGPRPETAGGDREPGSAHAGRGGSSTPAQGTVRPKEPGSGIPVVPERHRVPRKVETEIKPQPRGNSIPVAPGAHRIPRRSDR